MRAEPAESQLEQEVFPGEFIDSPAHLDDLPQRLEAVLFAAPRAVSPRQVGESLHATTQQVDEAVAQLNTSYARTGRVFRVVAVAGGWRMKTLEQHDDVIRQTLERSSPKALGQGARETLAIIAYRQPVLRADIEAIRGVASSEMLRQLLDEKLIRVRGRADLPGRPMLYGTTEKLLDLLGLQRLEQLPDVDG
jgi:segregation and condensation protein B